MANLNTPISVVTSESLESILWDIENCGVPCDVQPEAVAGNIRMATSTSIVRSDSSENRVTLMMDSNVNVLQPPMNQQNRIASDVPVVGNCAVRPEDVNILQPPMNQQIRIASDVPVVWNFADRPEDVNVLQPPMNQQNQTASDGPVAIPRDIENYAAPCDVRHEDVNVLQPPMNKQHQTASDGPVAIPWDIENCTAQCNVRHEDVNVLQSPMNKQNQTASDGPVAIPRYIENCAAPCDVRHEDVNVLQSPMNKQNQTASDGPVAILWDIENCCVPCDVRPEDVAGNIRMALRVHPVINGNGAVVMFSAYGDFNAFPVRLREGCQRTGVKLIDIPNGRKDAADKAILVDMFLFALDNPPPSSIVLISGDVDFAPALHILGQRGYTVILVIPSGCVSSALCSAGKFVWDWPSVAGGKGFVPPSKVLMPPRGAQMVEQVVTEEQRKNKKNLKKRCSSLASFSPPASSKRARKRQKCVSTARPGQQATSVANIGRSQGANIPLCEHCHRRHTGECWKANGACLRCGSKDHFLRDCSVPSKRSACSTQNQSGKKGKSRRVATKTIPCVVMPGEKQDAPDVILAKEQEKGEGSDQGKAKEQEKGEGSDQGKAKEQEKGEGTF